MLFNTVDRDTKLRQGTLGTVMSLAEKTQAERTIMTFFKKQAVAHTYRGRSSSCPQTCVGLPFCIYIHMQMF